MTPYYERAGVAIYHGDCLDVLPTLEKNCVDLVLTDPPYNCGMKYDQYRDDLSSAEYLAWCRDWWTLARAICPRTIVFPGNGNLWTWGVIAKPSAVGCWYKPGNGGSSIIGWEEWEPWLYWTGNRGLLGGSSVIRAIVGQQRSIQGHPCPKPIELIKRLLIKTKSAAVLDCFLGSGTTALAAQELGIRCIGIELSERYCEIAANRLRQAPLPFTIERLDQDSLPLEAAL